MAFDPNPLLSAAECAARTGLSTRALRLYEEHGLIAPRRSSGGWRQYGAEDLVRLNSIALLKSAGLTLAQIASLLGVGDRAPTLTQLLAMQLDVWKIRKIDADRGQRIVEAALERFRSDDSLTVDDLCSLIRSLEMTQPSDRDGSEEPDAALDEALLEQYVGFYQGGEWSVIHIRREGKCLLLDLPSRPAVELRPTSECDFESIGPERLVTFDRASDGTVSGLRLRMKGGDMWAQRIDSAAVEQLQARLAARIQARTPLPGTEGAVRQLVEDLRNGKFDYEQMHPALAYETRWQVSRLQASLAQMGAIQSIAFQGVGSAGWDVFDVQHQHGTSRFRILLGPNGTITGLLIVVKDGPPFLGP